MKGICIDIGSTTTLTEGTTYYLFENGLTHYYVSRFNNKNAHFGCFNKDQFQLLEFSYDKEPTNAHVPALNKEKIYKATLIWRKAGYKFRELKEYYLKPIKTHAYFYSDERLKDFCGCFPLHWFSDFVEFKTDEDEVEVEVEVKEPAMLPVDEWQQMSLF